MTKRYSLIGSVLAGSIALSLLVPSGAQPADNSRRGDSQKPTISTYDKRPDPPGDAQSIDAATYEETGDRTANPPTYNKRPDPTGANQDIEATRYEENAVTEDEDDDAPQNDPNRAGARRHGSNDPSRADANVRANDVGEVDNRNVRTEPVGSAVDRTSTIRAGSENRPRDTGMDADNDTRSGDSVKPTLRSYEDVPDAQNPDAARQRPNDVSNVDRDDERLGDDQKPVVPTYDKRPDSDGSDQDFDLIRYQETNRDNNSRGSQLQMRVLDGEVVE